MDEVVRPSEWVNIPHCIKEGIEYMILHIQKEFDNFNKLVLPLKGFK